MARIDFRGWRIESDETCWALGQPKTRHNARKELEIYLSKPTYYATLEGALGGLLKRELLLSDATTASGLLQELRQMREEIHELLGAGHVA